MSFQSIPNYIVLLLCFLKLPSITSIENDVLHPQQFHYITYWWLTPFIKQLSTQVVYTTNGWHKLKINMMHTHTCCNRIESNYKGREELLSVVAKTCPIFLALPSPFELCTNVVAGFLEVFQNIALLEQQ